MRAHLIICLGILLIAGCAAVPFDGPSEQDRPVKVVLNNSANETQTFEVWVVKRSETVWTRRSDGLAGNWSIGQGVGTRSSGPHPWTEVDLPDSARLHSRIMLEPGDENRSTIENFPRNYAVVVVLYQENVSGWWASASCDDRALIGIEVISTPSQYGEASAAYGCR